MKIKAQQSVNLIALLKDLNFKYKNQNPLYQNKKKKNKSVNKRVKNINYSTLHTCMCVYMIAIIEENRGSGANLCWKGEILGRNLKIQRLHKGYQIQRGIESIKKKV